MKVKRLAALLDELDPDTDIAFRTPSGKYGFVHSLHLSDELVILDIDEPFNPFRKAIDIILKNLIKEG